MYHNFEFSSKFIKLYAFFLNQLETCTQITESKSLVKNLRLYKLFWNNIPSSNLELNKVVWKFCQFKLRAITDSTRIGLFVQVIFARFRKELFIQKFYSVIRMKVTQQTNYLMPNAFLTIIMTTVKLWNVNFRKCQVKCQNHKSKLHNKMTPFCVGSTFKSDVVYESRRRQDHFSPAMELLFRYFGIPISTNNRWCIPTRWSHGNAEINGSGRLRHLNGKCPWWR